MASIPNRTNWDAWRNEDGRWTVQLAWKAGRSDNLAHFRFSPGAHGGTVTAVDDAATELIDPNFDRPRCGRLRRCPSSTSTSPSLPLDAPGAGRCREPEPAPSRAARKRKPVVPAWEDVLLGVRSSGQR